MYMIVKECLLHFPEGFFFSFFFFFFVMLLSFCTLCDVEIWSKENQVVRFKFICKFDLQSFYKVIQR